MLGIRRANVSTRQLAHGFKRTFVCSAKASGKSAYLTRQPKARPVERLKIGTSKVQHPDVPILSKTRGQEHVFPLDLDYMHVTPEDERRGLVLTGLHPKTRAFDVRKFLQRHTAVRNCWIHSEGIACVRFQDEECQKKARKLLEEQKTYPFPVYDEGRRNWSGKVPEEYSPIQTLSLTTNYDREMPAPGRVLLLRSLFNIPPSILALFAPYGEGRGKLRPVLAKFRAHDKWVWEYYLPFPDVEKANEALKDYGGKEVTIPYHSLTTTEKLQFPYGKKVHLWLRHTGLNSCPKTGSGDTILQKLVLSPTHPLSKLYKASPATKKQGS